MDKEELVDLLKERKLSVLDSLKWAQHELRGAPKDIHKSIDEVFYTQEITKPPPIVEIDQSLFKSRQETLIMEIITETKIKLAQYKVQSINTQDIAIFYDELMIGYHSNDNEEVKSLGWGSNLIGNEVAKRIDSPIIEGNIVVILTRHKSKYAHFVQIKQVNWCSV